MSPILRLVPAAILTLSGALAAAAPAPRLAGTVTGAAGGVVTNARVCLDRNRNARCDAGEPSTFSRDDGSYALRGASPLAAELSLDSTEIDPATGQHLRPRRLYALRAPAGWHAISPVSTEVQAMADAGGTPAAAWQALGARLGVTPARPEGDPADASDPALQRALADESARLAGRLADALEAAGARGDRAAALRDRLALDDIRTVVVIYAENRSFDNLFGGFPGARASLQGAPQKDRDGTPLAKLPAVWKGLTETGQAPAVTEAQTANVLPNGTFQVDAARPAWGGPALGNETVTRDLVHRFFENQMQIGDGSNDRFAAWGDSGGLVMGTFDGGRTALWKLARQYTLADAFFQGAFGGSFLNHQYLICACAPDYPGADTSPARPSIAALELDAKGDYLPRLAQAPNSPPSALAGPPVWVKNGNLVPKDYFGAGDGFRAVNTMQPAYQPSFVPPAKDEAAGRYADPAAATTLPAQTQTTIGDLLSARGVSWAWYSGGWNAALADRTTVYDARRGSFQSHHQPFNYYASFDPAANAKARAAHLKDEEDLVADAAAGTLPAVAFYKPIGTYNEHPSTTSIALSDAHLGELVARLQKSPQWPHMLVVLTYDEFGGQWDEAAPPRGDLLGPGTRIPAIVVSPYARRGFVDHTPYDTGSVLRFVTHRFALPELAGLQARDDALVANGGRPMGDLSNALSFAPAARQPSEKK